MKRALLLLAVVLMLSSGGGCHLVNPCYSGGGCDTGGCGPSACGPVWRPGRLLGGWNAPCGGNCGVESCSTCGPTTIAPTTCGPTACGPTACGPTASGTPCGPLAWLVNLLHCGSCDDSGCGDIYYGDFQANRRCGPDPCSRCGSSTDQGGCATGTCSTSTYGGGAEVIVAAPPNGPYVSRPERSIAETTEWRGTVQR